MYKYKVGEDGGHGRMWTFAPERVMDSLKLHRLHRRRRILIVYSVLGYDVQIFNGQEVRRAGR
ncbi:hypothetical protein J3E68DRAFT_394360 [Trichoderma sp. SZMC 28012]